MPDFNVSGNMKVKTLQANYKKAYGGTLRVYKGNQFADPDTLYQISVRRIPKVAKFLLMAECLSRILRRNSKILLE